MNKLNVIVITPHARAGSMLMQSLFDSHPEIISFPFIYDNMQLTIIEYNFEATIDTFINCNKYSINFFKLLQS